MDAGMSVIKFDKHELNHKMAAHLMPPYVPRKHLSEVGLIILTEGKGVTVEDIEGREYLLYRLGNTV